MIAGIIIIAAIVVVSLGLIVIGAMTAPDGDEIPGVGFVRKK